MNARLGVLKKLAVLAFFAVNSIVFLGNNVERCEADYFQNDQEVTYDCLMVNQTVVRFTINVTINSNSSSYDANLTSSINLNDKIVEYINGIIIIDAIGVSKLERYDLGIRHTSWMSRMAVHNETGNNTLVYGVDDGLLLMVNGTEIPGVIVEYFSMMMTAQSKVSGVVDTISSIFWIIVIPTFLSVLGFVIYIFAVRMRLKKRKEVKKISKSGRKLEKEKKKIVKKMKKE